MPTIVEAKRIAAGLEDECPAIIAKQAKKCLVDPSFGIRFQSQPQLQARSVSVSYGSWDQLSANVRSWVERSVDLCQPDAVHICDGSETENKKLLALMQKQGTIQPLPKYDNCWLARTDPADVARVESKTFICTPLKSEAIPEPAPGVRGSLGNWISPGDMEKAIAERFPGCMKGRTMYVVPFSMGPVGSPLAKVGVELTDSPYVVSSMRIMTRMGRPVLELLQRKPEFVKCLHSVGRPAAGGVRHAHWPCDPERTIILHRPADNEIVAAAVGHDLVVGGPERTIILHRPADNEIVSYGSGYGGNSLLGKKCLALRIGSTIAKREGWLAEHMLLLGITNPQGKKRYIAAAFPSACGKTNLAMMQPSLPGYKVECVGDDIAWMRFDSSGRLRAINPENGFFGVAPGTSRKTNPNAMDTVFKNTIFTNVASTSDGGVFWEGMEDEVAADVSITDWRGNPWTRASGTPAAHPNSRFCSPASQCPIIDPEWEANEGVPVDAILFGGRRPAGVPLVYEALSWQHGVFVGASMRSEATAAAEHKGKVVMNDPFAMRPFFGYNFGDYLAHWLSMEKTGRKLPKVFHVNWFRKGSDGKFLWPGFGENSRVLEWILRRVEGESVAKQTAVGFVPTTNSLRLDGLKEDVNMQQLFSLPKDFWLQEVEDIARYFNDQVGKDLPPAIKAELQALRERVSKM